MAVGGTGVFVLVGVGVLVLVGVGVLVLVGVGVGSSSWWPWGWEVRRLGGRGGGRHARRSGRGGGRHARLGGRGGRSTRRGISDYERLQCGAASVGIGDSGIIFGAHLPVVFGSRGQAAEGYAGGTARGDPGTGIRTTHVRRCGRGGKSHTRRCGCGGRS